MARNPSDLRIPLRWKIAIAVEVVAGMGVLGAISYAIASYVGKYW